MFALYFCIAFHFLKRQTWSKLQIYLHKTDILYEAIFMSCSVVMFRYVQLRFLRKIQQLFWRCFSVIRILKFDLSSFLQFPISLGMLPFLSDSLGFGFYSYRLSLLIRNCASSSKVSLTATYLFCSSALFLCSMDVAKHVGQLGLCMYRNSCLHYCISFKGI